MIKKENFTTWDLKIIAIILMVIDHVGAVILPAIYQGMPKNWIYLILHTLNMTMSALGRLAFPLFCYLLVCGFKNTSNRKKYLLRLVAFAIISQPAYNYFTQGKWLSFQECNIFVTLALGLLSISFYSYMESKGKVYKISSLFILAVLFFVSETSYVSYGAYGLFTILFMYIFYNNIEKMKKSLLVVNILKSISIGVMILLVYIQIYQSEPKTIISFMVMVVTVICGFSQFLGYFSVYFIKRYNGEQGFRGNKYFFYVFYPVHIIIIKFIAVLISN